MIKGLVTRATSPFKWLVDGVKFKSHLLQTTDSVLQTIKQKFLTGRPRATPTNSVLLLALYELLRATNH